MPVTVLRGSTDPVVDEIVRALETYAMDHSESRIDLYRQNSVSVRVRIIDPDFENLTRAERSRLVWRNYLASLTDDAQADISAMTLLAPEETERSIANIEFEDPTPSRL